LRIGTPEQVVKVLVSMSAPMVMVALADVGCSEQVMNPVPSDCSMARGTLFNANRSTTWRYQGHYGINNVDGSGVAAELGYSIPADYGTDSIGLSLVADVNGPKLESQAIAAFASVDFMYL
jgi:hypothetical protein